MAKEHDETEDKNNAAPEYDESPQPTEEHRAPAEETDGATPEPDDPGDPAETADKPGEAVVSRYSGNLFQRFGHWYRTHKKFSIPLTILVVVAILAAVPYTRYKIAGLVLKQNLQVTLTDSQTHQAVSGATVTVGKVGATSDGQGRATLHVPVGPQTVVISKKYYTPRTQKVTVPLFKASTLGVTLQATGRQVPVTVTNKITGKPLAGATIKALDTDAKTDTNGHATLVLPADKSTVAATVSADGFNNLAGTVQVTAQQVAANTFGLTPTGKVYFLSNLSGKIDVVSTYLDGTNRQTVVAGTGNEDATGTVLLASRDWKYLALLAKRDSGDAKLYLIDTATNALTTMDEGTNVIFTPVGWSNDTFVYTVVRQDVHDWQSNREALKSFDAGSKKLNTLDQTSASGSNQITSVYETYGQEFILPNNEIVYNKNIYSGYYALQPSQQATVNSVSVDGSHKKTIKAFPPAGSTTLVYVDMRPDTPSSVYVAFRDTTPAQFFEYEDGQIKTASDLNDQAFSAAYPTYLLSPTAKQTFWSEQRDGKNALFVGDQDGQNGKQIANLSEYQIYGWYTDNYLLVSKNASELYIMPANGSTQPLKVSDYYKPARNFNGYGGGYGGL
ncbi:MAG TPA: carboxypeptidase regulatory-like domain-containing protein [Candidatus Saccharimonadales bacterium]|nr:carboxypeptidase regulatory-like domain-containing protein [Candidatus Saccharimonadales bacterium]